MTVKAMPQTRTSLAMLQTESLLTMVEAAGGTLLLRKPAMRLIKLQGINRFDLDAANCRLTKSGHRTASGKKKMGFAGADQGFGRSVVPGVAWMDIGNTGGNSSGTS